MEPGQAAPPWLFQLMIICSAFVSAYGIPQTDHKAKAKSFCYHSLTSNASVYDHVLMVSQKSPVGFVSPIFHSFLQDFIGSRELWDFYHTLIDLSPAGKYDG